MTIPSTMWSVFCESVCSCSFTKIYTHKYLDTHTFICTNFKREALELSKYATTVGRIIMEREKEREKEEREEKNSEWEKARERVRRLDNFDFMSNFRTEIFFQFTYIGLTCLPLS